MRKKNKLTDEERQLFTAHTSGIKKLRHDTLFLKPYRANHKFQSDKRRYHDQHNELYFFSDSFQPLLAQDGPVRYLRPDADPIELKKLSRGVYNPDIFLDLHGLTQQQAKKELAALISLCRAEGLHCASVMHGHGRNILKRQTPLWLAQHPAIIAFHQATREFGGNSALLILIEASERDSDC